MKQLPQIATRTSTTINGRDAASLDELDVRGLCARHSDVDAISSRPSPAWILAFETQVTIALYEKASRYAAHRAEDVARAGGTVDDLYIAELVQDALGDTWAGTLVWDPDRASLEQQVMFAIKSRSRHDREKALRAQHVSFDVHGHDRHNPDVMAEVEASLASERPQANDIAAECADKSLAQLRVIARDDRDVALTLDAFNDGCFDKYEVMAATGLSAKRYRNAVHRLRGYARQLPFELRPTAGLRA